MKNLLQEISDAEKAVSAILHSFWQDDGLALEHLERAKAHLNEAWIAADGQNARNVQKLVEDIESFTKLFKAISEAAAGTEFKIGGKTFVKQSDNDRNEHCIREQPHLSPEYTGEREVTDADGVQTMRDLQ